jgi:hypothetical protein
LLSSHSQDGERGNDRGGRQKTGYKREGRGKLIGCGKTNMAAKRGLRYSVVNREMISSCVAYQ